MSGMRPGQAKGPWIGTVIDTTEVTGGANIGVGTGQVFSARVGHILNFRTLLQGGGITITTGANEITISSSAVLAVANVGTGTGLVWRDTIAGTVNLKSIKQGTGITVTNNADDITVTCTVTGESTTVSNVGTGAGLVYRDMTGAQINLKTIKAGTLITVTNNADDITLATTAQNNTASNLGTGTGVYATKSGSDLRFNSIKAGTGITVALVTNDITITAALAAMANVGTGTGLVYRDVTSNTVNLKSIKQGTGITVTNNADDITVTCTVSGESTTVSNVGTGTGLVYRDMTGAQINLKSVKQGTNITVTNNADDITISTTGIPTGSGTLNYMAYWSAATVLAASSFYTSGLVQWVADGGAYSAGGSTGVRELEISATAAGVQSYIGARHILIFEANTGGANIIKNTFGATGNIFNDYSLDYDTIVNGDNAEVVRVDAGDDALQVRSKLTVQGVIDNVGTPYTGGTNIAPTTIDLAAKYGSVLRLAPASEANRWYDITNAKNWQVIHVTNEGFYPAFIFFRTGLFQYYIVVPPSLGVSTFGCFATLTWNPNGSNAQGTWYQSSVQRNPISVALVDGANISVDASYGDCTMYVTLGGNRTLDTPTAVMRDGQKIVFRIIQDGTGGRTLAYGAGYRFSTDLPSPTLSVGANKIDYLGFIYNGASSKWDFVGKVFGFN